MIKKLVLVLALAVAPLLAQDAGISEVTIEHENLFPEGIAYDAEGDRFFIGSSYLGSILVMDRAGETKEFVPAKTGDMRGVLGLRVDPERNLLWAASASTIRVLNENPGMDRATGVFGFDLDTGELQQKIMLPLHEDRVFANDIAIDKRGILYVTTFYGGHVFRVDPETEETRVLLALDGMATNGITYSEESDLLYISANNSIYAAEAASGRMEELQSPDEWTLGHADGLYYHQGALIGVCHQMQGEQYSPALRRYQLAEDGWSVTAAEDILRDDPRFRLPTTGAIYGDRIMLLAATHINVTNSERNLQADPVSRFLLLSVPLR